MKKRIALLAAMAIFALSFSACAKHGGSGVPERSDGWIRFQSYITKEECLLCGSRAGHKIDAYFGQDNIGLIALNTFDTIPVEINRYDESGKQIEEATGFMQMKTYELGDTTARMTTEPDRGFAQVEIRPSAAQLDKGAIGFYLCQDCLDAFAGFHREHETISQIAVVNFRTGELSPLSDRCQWFASGDYLMGCEFAEDGAIKLGIIFRPVRYP